MFTNVLSTILSLVQKRTVQIILAIIVCITLVFLLFSPRHSLEKQIAKSQVYYSREGELLRIQLAQDNQYRIYAPLAEHSTLLLDTILLYEDRWFFYHFGINPITIIKGFYYSFIVKERIVGGSTISMQVARMLYHIQSSTIIGKIKQMWWAMHLELYFSKDEILEAYLNLVPMGGNISGYATAANLYFKKDVADLSLSEIITLTALPQNPNARRPTRNSMPQELTDAKERIFSILTNKYPQYIQDKKRILAPIYISYSIPFRAPHLVEYLMATKQTIPHTSLNLPIQEYIEQTTKKYILRKQKYGIHNASILLLNYNTMEVESLVGSVDYFNDVISGQVNGITAKRSPGSTLKPFIYALAIDQGLIHEGTMLIDAPTSFNEYTPDNFKSEYSGVISAQKALIYSRNIPAISLASQLVYPDLYDFLKQSRISSLNTRRHYGLSIVLGGAELTALELARLYAMLANHGILQSIKFTPQGDDAKPQMRKNLLSTSSTFITLEILYKNPPPNEKEAIPHSVAYKTGTSINFKDGWAVGIFDSYILVVWIGNFDGTSNPEFQGRYAAGPLLFALVNGIRTIQSSTPRDFTVPPQVTRIEVCKSSGMIPDPLCPQKTLVWYIPGVSPIEQSSLHRKIYLNKQGLRVEKNDPSAVKSEIIEVWPSHVMDIFAKTGIARKPVPPFADNANVLSQQGIAPTIISPNSSVSYTVSFSDTSVNMLPLQAHAEQGIEKLHWFGDNIYLGTSKPDEVLEIPLNTSVQTIKVIDELGRYDTKPVHIILLE